MGKPLPEHVTRAEAAEVLRLSLRQVDRLAETGKLKKRKLSASRSGFDREEFDAYLKSIAANDESYRSPFSAVAFVASADRPLDVNKVAQTLDRILHQNLPGCLVHVQDGDIEVFWNSALGYSAERILAAIKGG